MNDSARVEQLFTEALERANHIERHVFLTAACGNDTALWNEVWDRLRNRPVTEATGGRQRRTRGIKVAKTPPNGMAVEKPGDMIGPYRLLQIIDEDVCSVMWMAERNQRVADFVAIKVVHAGANDFLMRYEAQKHSLALLDHPGIARPHSGGMTASGKPYLVMELVHGTPVTQFCDEQKLSMLQRIRLFAQACDAIQHAHQQGVVHGDLKPSNFLARWDENGKPVVKVTDFGVAKAMNHALLTPEGVFRTPAAYLSPEHVRGAGIDARSDVYSLGVLLYELITGRPPFQMPKEDEEHVEEIRQRVCGLPPPKPSACLAAMPKAPLTGVSLARQVQPADIIGLMEEHFDWIVMRTLDKRPQERYGTVSALVNDFQRYVTEAAAVEEKPQDQRPVTNSFFRDHPGLCTLAACLVLLATAVMMLVGWLIVKERKETAEAARKRNEESGAMTARFFHDMFAALTPEKAKGHDTTLLKNMLDEAAGNLDTLASSPEAGARTQETIGLTYLAISQPDDAHRQLQGALEKRKLALGNTHQDTLRTMKDLAVALKEQGRHADAELMLRRALAGQQRTLGPDHPDTFVTITVLAAVCDAQEKHAEAETLFLQLWQVQKRVLGPDHLDTLATIGNLASCCTAQGKAAEAMKLRNEQLAGTRRVVKTRDPRTIVTMNLTAEACEAGGMPSEAEKLYFGALEIMKQALGAEHPGTLEQLDKAAMMVSRRGRHNEAIQLHRQSLEAKRRVFGPEHPQTLLSVRHLAEEDETLGKLAEAEGHQLDVLESLKTVFPPEHPEILEQMDTVAQTYERHEKHAEAATLRRQTLAARQRRLGSSHPQTLRSMQELAMSYDAAGRAEEARTLHLQTLENMKAAYGPGDPDVLGQMHVIAVMHDRHGRLAEAETTFRELLQIQMRALGPTHADTLRTLTALAATHQHQGRLEEAEKLHQQVLASLRELPEADPGAIAAAAAGLGAFWLETGRFAEAETILRECLELRRKHQPGHWLRFSTESLLGGSLLAQKKYAEAGTLLRSGYEGLNAFGTELPREAMPHFREALARMTQFTEATGGLSETQALKQRMAQLDNGQQVAGQ